MVETTYNTKCTYQNKQTDLTQYTSYVTKYMKHTFHMLQSTRDIHFTCCKKHTFHMFQGTGDID